MKFSDLDKKRESLPQQPPPPKKEKSAVQPPPPPPVENLDPPTERYREEVPPPEAVGKRPTVVEPAKTDKTTPPVQPPPVAAGIGYTSFPAAPGADCPPGTAQAIPPPPLEQPSIPAKSRNVDPDPEKLSRHKEAADALYGLAIRTIKNLFQSPQTPPPELFGELKTISEEMLRQIQEENPYVSINTRYSTASSYFYAHSVNVATLSLLLTDGLGWEEEDRILLGTAALLHEVGMSRFLHLAQAPRELTSEERKEIRLHPLASQELLGHIQNTEESLKNMLSEIVGQVHERANGSGYPHGIGREKINLGAQIIGLCDIYEALSHPRNWRNAMLPHDTIKLILRDNAEEFDRHLLKALLEQLSLYPPGSYVRLSTHEIGRVLQVNPSFPTRPLVEIRIQADKTKEDPPKIVNLLKRPLIHVSQAVDETRIAVKDPRLRLQFEASRWWTD